MFAAGHPAAAHRCGELVETCPDEMSWLFMKVSLRRLTLFSLLPLHIRLLITVTLGDPPSWAISVHSRNTDQTSTAPL